MLRLGNRVYLRCAFPQRLMMHGEWHTILRRNCPCEGDGWSKEKFVGCLHAISRLPSFHLNTLTFAQILTTTCSAINQSCTIISSSASHREKSINVRRITRVLPQSSCTKLHVNHRNYRTRSIQIYITNKCVYLAVSIAIMIPIFRRGRIRSSSIRVRSR